MVEDTPDSTSLHHLLFAAKPFTQDPSTNTWSVPAPKFATEQQSSISIYSQPATITPKGILETAISSFSLDDTLELPAMPIVPDNMAEFVAQCSAELSGTTSRAEISQEPQNHTPDVMSHSTTMINNEVPGDQDVEKPTPNVETDQHTPLQDTCTNTDDAEYKPGLEGASEQVTSLKAEVEEDIKRTRRAMERETTAKEERKVKAQADENAKDIESASEMSQVQAKRSPAVDVSGVGVQRDLEAIRTNLLSTVAMLVLVMAFYLVVRD